MGFDFGRDWKGEMVLGESLREREFLNFEKLLYSISVASRRVIGMETGMGRVWTQSGFEP